MEGGRKLQGGVGGCNATPLWFFGFVPAIKGRSKRAPAMPFPLPWFSDFVPTRKGGGRGVPAMPLPCFVPKGAVLCF